MGKVAGRGGPSLARGTVPARGSPRVTRRERSMVRGDCLPRRLCVAGTVPARGSPRVTRREIDGLLQQQALARIEERQSPCVRTRRKVVRRVRRSRAARSDGGHGRAIRSEGRAQGPILGACSARLRRAVTRTEDWSYRRQKGRKAERQKGRKAERRQGEKARRREGEKAGRWEGGKVGRWEGGTVGRRDGGTAGRRDGGTGGRR
jgi:hypothetical protein